MSRFFIPKGSVSGSRITVKGDELHHARDVMRLREGDKITVFDGTGMEYTGTIDKVGKMEMTAVIINSSETPGEKCRLTLLQAVPKASKMDLIIEKATELGVSRIVPVITSRTVMKMSEGGNRTQRWNKITMVAAKQCGRSVFPEIAPVSDFKDALSYLEGCDLSLIPCLYEGNRPIKDVIKGRNPVSVCVLIGPEGDFTAPEVRMAVERGAIPVILGNEVLRSETAAVTVLSVLGYEFRW